MLFEANLPEKIEIAGSYVKLIPLSARMHGDDLWEEVGRDAPLWRFLSMGSFGCKDDFLKWVELSEVHPSRVYYAVVAPDGRALGGLSLMNFAPQDARVELGAIFFGKRLQKTREATEALFLLMRYAFVLGNRRLEWRCNNLNEPSKRAALRLGFIPEGVLRQHMVVKGSARDTAMFSLLVSEWLKLERGFKQWLLPENFDAEGLQKQGLNAFLLSENGEPIIKISR